MMGNQQQPLLLSRPPQQQQLLLSFEPPKLHPPQHTRRRMMIRIQLQLLPHILSNLLLIDVRHSMRRKQKVLQEKFSQKLVVEKSGIL
ncbi:MAG TPA: hypothetical protein IAC43_04030 [Candidatus Faecivivens stercoripullorum]|uniref:Uncharacterized protein n=1 Tax=Candidatus Faecivivens stercoripullorum TaxID=2840805 RepID=A0A9D1KRJ6_9FIRM|nr:hypothetical protein [Candidatus Faecivivens stercoripullorum]